MAETGSDTAVRRFDPFTEDELEALHDLISRAPTKDELQDALFDEVYLALRERREVRDATTD